MVPASTYWPLFPLCLPFMNSYHLSHCASCTVGCDEIVPQPPSEGGAECNIRNTWPDLINIKVAGNDASIS